MEVIFKIATRELKEVKELSFYNHITHEVKGGKYCFTHIQEVYDDVNEYPSYLFGTLVDDKFTKLFAGEGEPVPDNMEDMGGVFIEIYINCPEYLNLNKQQLTREG